MNKHRVFAPAAAAFLSLLTGCTGDVGRLCVNPSGNVSTGSACQTIASSPALECQSRLCLIQESPNGDRLTCTEECTSDAECQADTATTALCSGGFACAAVNDGTVAGRKLCVCRDDLPPGNDTTPLTHPAGCTPPPPPPMGDVGKPCINEFGPAPNGERQTILSSPALECDSRLCLTQDFVGDVGDHSTCTEECTSDAECQADTVSTAFCAAGFACAAVTDQGGFACQKFCICRSDLVCGLNSDAAGNVVTPFDCPNGSPKPSCPITVQVPPGL
jgi:hypothetical protein